MDATWRKSSYSGGNGGGCIEVGTRSEAGRVLVRDTKDRQGPALALPDPEFPRRTMSRVDSEPTRPTGTSR